MRQNGEWGTHAELFAVALYFKKPVYTAIQKQDLTYWAKYSSDHANEEQLTYSAPVISLPPGVNHFEICLCNSHYDAILSDNHQLPCNPPYTSDTSANMPGIL